jgi:chorismate mutase
MVKKEPSLGELRRFMDKLDDRLHDLLVERFSLVRQVAEAKALEAGTVAATAAAPQSAIRPGREAQVLRRLVAQNRGELPAEIVVKVWRELISTATHMQGPYGAFVFDGDQSKSYWDLARFYFGALTPLTLCKAADDILQAVMREKGCVGMLPSFNSAQSTDGKWIKSLSAMGENRPRIVAQLPFIHGSASSLDFHPALIVAAFDPEASGDDTSLLSIKVASQVSEAELQASLQTSGFHGVDIMLGPNSIGDDGRIFVVAVDGFVVSNDKRLSLGNDPSRSVFEDVMLLGAFANPIDLSGRSNSRAGS